MLPGDTLLSQSLNVGMNILKYSHRVTDDDLWGSDVRAMVSSAVSTSSCLSVEFGHYARILVRLKKKIPESQPDNQIRMVVRRGQAVSTRFSRRQILTGNSIGGVIPCQFICYAFAKAIELGLKCAIGEGRDADQKLVS